MTYEYTTYEKAHDAIEVAIKDTVADNPQLSEDEVYWDMVQAIMPDCDPDTLSELSQRSGVDVPGWLKRNRRESIGQG